MKKAAVCLNREKVANKTVGLELPETEDVVPEVRSEVTSARMFILYGDCQTWEGVPVCLYYRHANLRRLHTTYVSV